MFIQSSKHFYIHKISFSLSFRLNIIIFLCYATYGDGTSICPYCQCLKSTPLSLKFHIHTHLNRPSPTLTNNCTDQHTPTQLYRPSNTKSFINQIYKILLELVFFFPYLLITCALLTNV